MDLEQKLQENLQRFCIPADGNIFLVDREIAIARYALNCQFEAYARSIEILTGLLERSVASANIDANTLTNVMVTINSIEVKSQSLIDSAKKVTELLGEAVAIDIDKAALRTMVCQLPLLVKESIASLSGDPDLADNISLNLSNRIDEMMQRLRFAEEPLPETGKNAESLTLDQYHSLINSVPGQPQLGALIPG